MTAQIPDILIVRGRRLPLCETPLHPYMARLAKARRPRFLTSSTACWRGYIATWEMTEGGLFLTGIDGWIARDGDAVRAGLATAFPWLKPPVPVRWFSGELRCPEGRLVAYRHAGFASRYERDRLFHVTRGRLDAEWLRINPPDEVVFRIDAEGRRTRFDSMRRDAAPLPDLQAPDETPDGRPYWAEPPEADAPVIAVADDYVLAAETLFGRAAD